MAETPSPTASPAQPSWIQSLQAILASPPPRRGPRGEGRQAAVLVPLYVEAGELWTILTQRAEHLPTHKSQYAFPGGALELGEDAWAAALRESREEIALDPKKVLPLGELDEVASQGGYSVIPCVGAVPFPVETKANEAEIADIFAVPLSAFANPQLVEDRPVTVNGVERMLRVYHIGRRRVWGMTAVILKNLLVRVGLEADPEAS